MSEPARRTILLVEDEEAVRKLVCHILERQGFQILLADGAEGAMAAIEARAEPGGIHLLLTDIRVRGGMDGCRLARAARARLPELRVLFMSGFPGDAAVQAEVEAARAGFLAKPFSPLTLLSAVRQCLEGRDQSGLGQDRGRAKASP